MTLDDALLCSIGISLGQRVKLLRFVKTIKDNSSNFTCIRESNEDEPAVTEVSA